MHTRDTAGTGSGMPRYAKVQHRTRTRTTRLGNTAGFSVPVPNPSDPEGIWDTLVEVHRA